MFSSTVSQVKKRSGEVVVFDAEKILKAINKAMISTRGQSNRDEVEQFLRLVIKKIEERFPEDRYPSVEDVQNVVELVLLEGGYFDVAKSYIIYRYEHAKQREVQKKKVQEKIEQQGLYILKRNGKKELFSLEKLKKHLKYIARGYENIADINVIADQVRSEIYEDISTVDIERTLIMVLRSWIEQDPAYSFMAARALLYKNYKEVIGTDQTDFSNIQNQLRQTFVNNIMRGVAIGKLDPKMLTYDVAALAAHLDFSRDEQHTYLSAQTLVDRYFIRDEQNKDVIETPQGFWMRVAMGLAIAEKDRHVKAKEFYDVMSKLHYVPSTPTLFHAGTSHPQLSSCYLTTIEDSLDHIFKCISDNAQLSKWSGGIGNDWTNLRGIGALIKGTGVPSQGIVPFLKVANDTTAAINRSGRRRGATCAYLETWHWDIEDFLELRKNTGDERRRTHDMNTSNWIPDLFMKRLREHGEWSLFSPDETPDLHDLYGKAFEKRYMAYERMGEKGELNLYKKVKAQTLWKKMVAMLFETGHPWITFKDPCNLRSPQDHVGVVHSSNLCTEITLNTSASETAVCNLGSVNLEKHIIAGRLDEAMIENTVTTAMRMLDNVININFYPTKEAKNANMRHRPVGLGVMGFQNALYKLGINFDSDKCVQFADESMEIVSYYAIRGSALLAKDRGPYKTYRGSKWDRGIFPVDTLDILQEERGIKIDVSREAKKDWTPVRKLVEEYGMRNSNCMAIAPTATISNITGTTPTVEPIYKNIYVKSNQAGDFTVVNPYLVKELKELNLWDSEMLGKLKYNDGSVRNIAEIPAELKDKYKETFEVGAKWIIKAAAYRAKWIDQSQSVNVFYAGKSGKEISDIYMYAWELGLKTTYYLRTLGISQVEKSTIDTKKHGDTHKRGATQAQTTAPKVAPTATPVAVKTPQPAMATPEPQLCRIEDPDCEACQ